MSESLVRKFMMSPRKVGDLVYKVQVGKNGAHKMIRKQSKAGVSTPARFDYPETYH